MADAPLSRSRDVPISQRGGVLAVSPAPHIRGGGSSARRTWTVSLCLMPATAWGVFLFGLPAAIVLLMAIGSAVAAESLATLPFGKRTLGDGSAFLSGLLVGLLMPPGVPLYVPVAASLFAILVVKQSFGGLGNNWMNPAMAGVVFSLFSWGGAMSRWVPPRGVPVDAAVLSPLEALRSAFSGGAASGNSLLAIVGSRGYPFSGLDARVIGWINAHLLSPLGGYLPRGVFDLAIGNVAGRIGEVSVPLLLLGAGYLIARRIIRWQIPTAYIAVFIILSWIFGGLSNGQGWLRGGVFYHLFAGSLVLAGFYMATDPVTSPLNPTGRILYGAGLGLFTFLLRFYGSAADGVPLALILGNCFVPLIDILTRPRRMAPQKAPGI